ncbi:MAG: filamentous hemagglutinin N-terminal domain-containing protein [Scytonematopsis contorta HA4267-MV1]|jgi:filamentous hemagglutinin family protein|nr:filamentous hemagglutinin N-terminal domain-containing protein [Scytonematopsis contorta HA4267-MV1]
MTIQQDLFSKFLIQGFVGFSFLLFIDALPVKGQITPDNTLGAESSRITPGALINGVNADKIDGGAQRGNNLFHSFSEFNINNGQRVYFSNPTEIENILTRVTGGKISNILGTLGVDGAANLFLINPNGILFGQNSQLDVRGSFVGTTASGVQFGEQGIFSTANPEAPPLLTINPSALFFNQINPEAKINVQSQASAGTNPLGNQTNGLRVPDGKSLLLLGGDINLTSTGLRAYGGKVELAGLAAPGTVGLTGNGTQLGLVIPSDVTRANVSIIDSVISGFAATAGEISIYSRNLDIVGTSLYGGIGDGLGFVGAQAGDIKLDTTDTITLRQESIIDGNLGKK